MINLELHSLLYTELLTSFIYVSSHQHSMLYDPHAVWNTGCKASQVVSQDTFPKVLLVMWEQLIHILLST